MQLEKLLSTNNIASANIKSNTHPPSTLIISKFIEYIQSREPIKKSKLSVLHGKEELDINSALGHEPSRAISLQYE